ncbi:hypothetical protein BaRGS_00000913, partial [Batillaria attramentaria]
MRHCLRAELVPVWKEIMPALNSRLQILRFLAPAGQSFLNTIIIQTGRFLDYSAISCPSPFEVTVTSCSMCAGANPSVPDSTMTSFAACSTSNLDNSQGVYNAPYRSPVAHSICHTKKDRFAVNCHNGCQICLMGGTLETR